MGYTHYWYRKPELDPTKFQAFAGDVRQLVELAREVRLGNWQGEGKPEITAERVSFNGRGDEGCETFLVMPTEELQTWRAAEGKTEVFAFCKTRYLPYDVVVVASILALLHHFPEAHAASDGCGGDLDDGVALYLEAFPDRTPRLFGDE